MDSTKNTLVAASLLYLRFALAAAYLSSVASRFGLWGEGMGWGNFENFLDYTAKVNPFVARPYIPLVGWTATVAETVIAVFLIIGFRLKETAILSGIMLILFAIGMSLGFNIKEPLDYSVYTASAASFLLAALYKDQKDIAEQVAI